jgi:hypothetical protein
MTRTLERRLARLEERVLPSGPPHTLQINFVSADGKVTGTRVIEFPWCPPLRRATVADDNGTHRAVTNKLW